MLLTGRSWPGLNERDSSKAYKLVHQGLFWYQIHESGQKPNFEAKILATKFAFVPDCWVWPMVATPTTLSSLEALRAVVTTCDKLSLPLGQTRYLGELSVNRYHYITLFTLPASKISIKHFRQSMKAVRPDLNRGLSTCIFIISGF